MSNRDGGDAGTTRPTADPLLLQGVRVLDLADTSGAVCGRTLADLGADVIRVEPPGGHPDRLREGPFAHDRVEADTSLTWLATNVNKRGITCSLESAEGRALFLRLASRADVVVESFEPGHLAALGLSYEVLADENPALVLASITPYGQSGPMANLPGSDLEVTAASGSLWLAGEPDGPPVRGTIQQSPHWTGMYAAMGTILALLARDANEGRGQVVDTSAQASMLTAISHAPAFWDLLREEQKRSGQFLSGRSVTGAQFRNLWPCRDGFVTFALYGGPAGRHTSKQLVAWMEERGGAAPEVLKSVNWDNFDVATTTQEEADRLEAAISPFIRQVTKVEFAETVVKRNMLGYAVATPEDISRDEQLQARDFWQQVETPWGETTTFPGSFVLVDGERPPIRRTAPRAGQHNVEVYQEWLGLSSNQVAELAARGTV